MKDVTDTGLSTTALLEKLAVYARKRTTPTIVQIETCRDLLTELRTRRPDAFEAVADIDAGSRAYLPALLKAAGYAPPARRTPAKDDAELCASTSWCRPIELDGTGFSGCLCTYPVTRLRPLISRRPDLGKTRATESCYELARWYIRWADLVPGKEDVRLLCTRHAAAVVREHLARPGHSSPC